MRVDDFSTEAKLCAACLIADSVIMVAGRSLENAGLDIYIDGKEPVRVLESAVGGCVLHFAQFPATIKSGYSLRLSESGLDLATMVCEQFADLCSAARLSKSEQASIMATLLGHVAHHFGLKSDPRFADLLDQFISSTQLPRASGEILVIAGMADAVVTLASRVVPKEGAMVAVISDRVAAGAVLGTLGSLASIDHAVAHAVVRFLEPVQREGVMLLIDDGRIFQLDMRFKFIEDMAALFQSNGGCMLDAPSILARFATGKTVENLRVLERMRGEGYQPVHIPLAGFAFSVEHCVSLKTGLFITGWFVDPDRLFQCAVIADHSLANPLLDESWTCFQAMVATGTENRLATCFCAFLPRLEGAGWLNNPAITILLDNGEMHLARADMGSAESLAQRQTILSTIHAGCLQAGGLAKSYLPALAEINEAINKRQAISRIFDHGTVSTRKTSVLIPLYREIGFIRSQIMAFATDPCIRATCEIIYVLDDPEREGRVNFILGGTPYLTDLAVRLVVLERNGGYSLANNFGASVAHGETLVLMNSDVVPDGPGWLEKCVDCLDKLPEFSVVGPKLLYADRTLQHAGMYFFKMKSGEWQNMHYYKGYGAGFPAANVERCVPAVTGALMVLKKHHFLDVGGFTTDYVVGDYEDSDLCLKLAEKGGQCLYLPSAYLWHYERQSMGRNDQQTESGSTAYNRALHTSRWSARIEDIMALADFSEDANAY